MFDSDCIFSGLLVFTCQSVNCSLINVSSRFSQLEDGFAVTNVSMNLSSFSECSSKIEGLHWHSGITSSKPSKLSAGTWVTWALLILFLYQQKKLYIFIFSSVSSSKQKMQRTCPQPWGFSSSFQTIYGLRVQINFCLSFPPASSSRDKIKRERSVWLNCLADELYGAAALRPSADHFGKLTFFFFK